VAVLVCGTYKTYTLYLRMVAANHQQIITWIDLTTGWLLPTAPWDHDSPGFFSLSRNYLNCIHRTKLLENPSYTTLKSAKEIQNVSTPL